MTDGPKDDKIQKYVPWAVVGIAVLAGAWVLGDIIIRSLENLMTMAILAIGAVAVLMFLPTAVRLLRYAVWGADQAAIRANPIAQLEIGLKQHATMIDQMEGKIAESSTYYNDLAQMLKQNRSILSPEDLKDFEDELGTLKMAGAELVKTRDQEVENHRAFEGAVTAAKAKFAMGKAFSKVTATLRFDPRTGQATSDNQAALGAVNHQLSEGLARMQLALSRPRVTPRAMLITPPTAPPPALPDKRPANG